jgi:hypothetical protein
MKYINTYKIYEKLVTPDIISDIIYDKLDYIKSSIIKGDDFNLNIDDSKIVNNKLVSVKCNININIKIGNNYFGNIDHKLCISTNFNKCDITLMRPDKYDINLIIKTLSHELTHIYELYQIKSIFDDNKKWNINYKSFDDLYDSDIIVYFRDLIYTSRKHEINAKVSSLSIYLRLKRTNDLKQIKSDIIGTTEWNHYQALYNFNPKIYLTDLLKRYNKEFLFVAFNYLNKVIGSKTRINSLSDLSSYFTNTKRYFRKVCKEYRYKIDKIIHDIHIYNFNGIREEYNKIGYSMREDNIDTLLYPDYLNYI